MTSSTKKLSSDALAKELERGLSDLFMATGAIDTFADVPEHFAALALAQKAGARLEGTLRRAGMLTGPALVGDEAAWLGLRAEEVPHAK